MTDQKASKKVKITLAAPHTHGGKKHKAGDVIEVREDQAKRLIKANIATGD